MRGAMSTWTGGVPNSFGNMSTHISKRPYKQEVELHVVNTGYTHETELQKQSPQGGLPPTASEIHLLNIAHKSAPIVCIRQTTAL